jgi:arylsulfatase A-like enzyme
MKLTLTIVGVLLLAPLSNLHAATATKPNILILLADDLGYADIGVNGCTDIATPHIDSIAKNGIRFTQGYVSAPVCSPSRAGLMTGRYQTRFGHEFNHPLADRAPVGLPVSEKTAAQFFHDAGYVTGHVGKWHLGNPKVQEFSPQARGFGESVWFPGQRKLPPLHFFRHAVPGKVEDRYVDEAIAREAADFIQKHRSKPWFLYVAFLTPHQPLDTPPGTEQPFERIAAVERRKCAAMVTLLDGSVGRILRSLRETGQEERTLIVFLSDNGAPPKNGSRNTPLRGGKGTTWEGGIREPFVMQWAGVLPKGRIVDAPVIALDLLPTALAAAGVPSRDAKFDGVNLLPFLTGKTSTPPHAALFWRYGEQIAMRQGDWKLTRALDPTSKPPALITGLYNLREDVAEQRDRSATEPAKRKELERLWDTWNVGNVKALWGGAGGSNEAKADPELIEAVGKNIAACPDTGNWADNEVRYQGLAASFPKAVTCDFKARQLGPVGQHAAYDLKRCFTIGWEAGFRGPWCLEHAHKDRATLFRELGLLRDLLRRWMREA